MATGLRKEGVGIGDGLPLSDERSGAGAEGGNGANCGTSIPKDNFHRNAAMNVAKKMMSRWFTVMICSGGCENLARSMAIPFLFM